MPTVCLSIHAYVFYTNKPESVTTRILSHKTFVMMIVRMCVYLKSMRVDIVRMWLRLAGDDGVDDNVNVDDDR